MAADPPTDVRLTDTQARILVALCRPISDGDHLAAPATNQEIADAVFLSVDAVKGHLRTLYRKFGIDDLPAAERRARLVELAIAGGYVVAPAGEVAIARGAGDEDDDVPSPAELAAAEDLRPREVPEPVAPASAVRAGEPKAGRRRSLAPYITVGVLVLVVIGASLATSGIFNQGSDAQKAPTPAAYRKEVANDCRLALSGAPAAGDNRAARAAAYLGVIETMRGRLESLVPPNVPDIALERFSSGLANAAGFTADVAKSPPARGSAAEAEIVAELTFAAGQVQAGALGYGLGHDCLAIGDLIAGSAQNAAAP
ncbi:MAG TPA: helix-turn-helix transcriptional regulator [Solirubrobacterales bacterium]|nr:helix-turn-helix transcriptional regulator [Solirubrobacterales bacterium]